MRPLCHDESAIKKRALLLTGAALRESCCVSTRAVLSIRITASRRWTRHGLHVIVGAGPVGTATARLLAERGERVRVVTRRGTGPEHPAIERVAADAADAGPARRADRGRGRALQLRQPGVPPVADRLAAAGRRAAHRRRAQPARCWPPSATSTATARSTAR